MLLTITYKGKETQNLGYLLHKNPTRPQSFQLSYGNAYVFYPEISDEQTTVALLMDTNPIDLACGKLGSRDGGLFDYVNDRPYVASSFMSTALARVFNTAMNGRCDAMPELVKEELDLTARVYSLPVRADKTFLNEVFEPLGYQVAYETKQLDEQFEEWGESPYVDLTLTGTVKLSVLLNHLYVLIPVFDRQKHYYVTREEIDKLMKHGEGWLKEHPQSKRIISRYFMRSRSYANQTMERLMEQEPEEIKETEDAPEQEEEKEEWTPLNILRLNAVKDAVLKSGATSVIDLGCGGGKLTSMLLEEKQLQKVTGVDVSVQALEIAKRRLKVDRLPTYKKDKLTLMQGSLIYQDRRFSGYDCATIVEVIEHIDLNRQGAFEQVVFVHANPKTVIITTPNHEYNAHYEGMQEGALRHTDHRFEWTRKEFEDWTKHICETYGYTVEITGIGETDEAFGEPTQMGVFTRCE